MFSTDLAATLSGASANQLRSWSRTNLLRPEYDTRPAKYSFRDVMALRAVAKLRTEVSLQKIRTAFRTLDDMDLTDHPSAYSLTTDGKSVFLVDSGEATDLVTNRGQSMLSGLLDIFRPFRNMQGRQVPDLLAPRAELSLREGIMGGFPTIRGTAIAYDIITNLVGDGSVPISWVSHYYPNVSERAAEEALDFEAEVISIRSGEAA